MDNANLEQLQTEITDGLNTHLKDNFKVSDILKKYGISLDKNVSLEVVLNLDTIQENDSSANEAMILVKANASKNEVFRIAKYDVQCWCYRPC